MEDITDADHKDSKRVLKTNLKNLDKHHDLYVQSHTLLFADVFHNSQIMRLEIYGLDSVRFFSAPGLAGEQP